jgi:hypothetical protein
MSESGMHYYAKITLAAWLRKMIGKNFKGLNNIQLNCTNSLGKCSSPMFGVYTEYPICLANCGKGQRKLVGFDTMWDSVESKELIKAKAKHGIPSKYELKNNDKLSTILHIFDIAVVSDDKIVAVFEIKYTHAMDNKKIRFVEKSQIPTYEIDAEWVLKRPRGKIPFELEYLESYAVNSGSK